MIIGIDANEANVKERVGVSVYTMKLLEYFYTQANKDLRFVIYLKTKPLSDMPVQSAYFQYAVFNVPAYWSQVFLPFQLYTQRLTGKSLDIFFSPAHYAPRFCPSLTIVTIHDLSYFYYPDEFLKKDFYKLKNWTKYSIEKATKIIAVSKTTKKDIVKFYHVPEEKIEVIYNGFEKTLVKNSTNHQPQTTPYILYVGTLQPRKNIPVLIKAFKAFHTTYPDFKLIIAGKKGWMFDNIYKTVKENGLEKCVRFTGYINDNELVALYRKAFCFVMPSLYEGFGIPVLEAMSYGCPVISSFASSLPEIGSEACLYFDPSREDDLLNTLIKLKESVSIRKELIQKGKERVTQFSWTLCAEKTLDIIKNTANQ